MGSFVLDGQQHMGIRPAGRFAHPSSGLPWKVSPSPPAFFIPLLSHSRGGVHICLLPALPAFFSLGGGKQSSLKK